MAGLIEVRFKFKFKVRSQFEFKFNSCSSFLCLAEKGARNSEAENEPWAWRFQPAL